MESKNEFSEKELKHDWDGLLRDIKSKLSYEDIDAADKAFAYFKEHGTYKEFEYDEDELDEAIADSTEVSHSGESSSSPEGSPEHKHLHVDSESDEKTSEATPTESSPSMIPSPVADLNA